MRFLLLFLGLVWLISLPFVVLWGAHQKRLVSLRQANVFSAGYVSFWLLAMLLLAGRYTTAVVFFVMGTAILTAILRRST